MPNKTHPSWQIATEVGEGLAKDRQEAEKQAAQGAELCRQDVARIRASRQGRRFKGYPPLATFFLCLGIVLILLLPSSVQAHPPAPHLRCTSNIQGDFCSNIFKAHQRLKDNYWTKWWADWADEHEVLVEESTSWGALPYRNTVLADSHATGSVRDSILLLHEIQHLADDYGLPQGVTCSRDPYSHERVYFWTMLGAVALGDTEWAWAFYTTQSGYYYQARSLPYGLGEREPCREQGAVETAPNGVTYTQLRGLLPWWD